MSEREAWQTNDKVSEDPQSRSSSQGPPFYRQSEALDRPGCESVHTAIHRWGLDADPWGYVPAFNSRTLGQNRRRSKGGNDSREFQEISSCL